MWNNYKHVYCTLCRVQCQNERKKRRKSEEWSLTHEKRHLCQDWHVSSVTRVEKCSTAEQAPPKTVRGGEKRERAEERTARDKERGHSCLAHRGGAATLTGQYEREKHERGKERAEKMKSKEKRRYAGHSALQNGTKNGALPNTRQCIQYKEWDTLGGTDHSVSPITKNKKEENTRQRRNQYTRTGASAPTF